MRPSHATDHPVLGTKLVVVDKLALSGTAKVVFLARDQIVQAGLGTDAAAIEASLQIAYDGASGTFIMPSGSGWRFDGDGSFKYANPSAPVGGTVKRSTIKPGTLVKVQAKSLGEPPLDVTSPPSDLVYVAHIVVNDGAERRHCTQFAGCQHRSIAAGTGYKLACKAVSATDGACVATTPACITNRYVDQGLTVLDTCTTLEWEKKQGTKDDIQVPGNLHEVDNAYAWAGRCSNVLSKLCQPNVAAEAACKAATPPALWTGGGCDQCTGGEGTCTFSLITTIWDWLQQVNAENFAGHGDWRLPTSAGSVSGPTDQMPELESIVAPGFLLGWCGGIPGPPCIDPVFGPTHPFTYWSASSFAAPFESGGFAVTFFRDEVRTVDKFGGSAVRAVR